MNLEETKEMHRTIKIAILQAKQQELEAFLDKNLFDTYTTRFAKHRIKKLQEEIDKEIK